MMWRAPRFFKGLRCESKLKTTEEQEVEACSLARNILGGKGVCWNSEMGLGRMTSINYSHGPAQDQTQGWLVHGWNTFGARNKPQPTRTHKTHHGPNLGEITTLPLLIYFVPLYEAYIQKAFCPGSPKIPTTWTSMTLGAHNFACKPPIEITFKAKL
jgi:hypothetical protein